MKYLSLIAIWICTIVGLTAPLSLAQAAELVMVERNGCYWCERWDEEIAGIYPKSEEGKFAPLRRVNVAQIPQTLQLKSKAVFTPTFILIENNKELARLEGYPGEDFFWQLLNEMLKSTTSFKPRSP